MFYSYREEETLFNFWKYRRGIIYIVILVNKRLIEIFVIS